MSIDVKISKHRIPYKKAMFILEKRVDNVKKGLKKEPSLDNGLHMTYRTPFWIINKKQATQIWNFITIRFYFLEV